MLAMVAGLGWSQGCGGDEEAPSRPVEPEPAPAPIASEVPDEPEPYEDPPLDPSLPPAAEIPNPSERGQGETRLRATACPIEGPLVFFEAFENPGLAVSRDGQTAYLVDGAGRLRRYTIRGDGAECALVPDLEFARHGRLDLLGEGGFDAGRGDGGRGDEGRGDGDSGHAGAVRIDQIDIDDQDRVYVSSLAGSLRFADGALTHCPSTGSLSMRPDGAWGLSLSEDGLQRVTWSTSGCEVTPFSVEEPLARMVMAWFSGEELFIAGSATSHVVRMRRYGPDGVPRGERWGGDDLRDPDKLCVPGNVVSGRLGPVVLDQNCRAILLTRGDGDVAARIDAIRLFGLRYPWVENLTEPQDGTAYAAVSQQRGRSTGHYDFYVFRVSGL